MSRLDDIRSRAVFLKRSDGEFSDIIQLDVDDYAYLYEQTNRAEELERDISNYKKACSAWEVLESYGRKESQRYKQALEFYADEDNHISTIAYKNRTPIDDDGGEKARKALKEGEGMNDSEDVKAWLKFSHGSLADSVRRIVERNEFLEKAHQTNIKISGYALEENQRYKQALEDIKRILDTYPHVDYSKIVTRRRLFDLANESLKGESE